MHFVKIKIFYTEKLPPVHFSFIRYDFFFIATTTETPRLNLKTYPNEQTIKESKYSKMKYVTFKDCGDGLCALHYSKLNLRFFLF